MRFRVLTLLTIHSIVNQFNQFGENGRGERETIGTSGRGFEGNQYESTEGTRRNTCCDPSKKNIRSKRQEAELICHKKTSPDFGA